MYEIPEAIQNYKLYNEGQEFIGTTTVDFPALTALTAEVKGAGIGGTISKPIVGHFDSMSATLNIRAAHKDQYKLLKAGRLHLECWGSLQVSQGGRYISRPHRVIFEGDFKSLTTGKHSVGEAQDRTLEIEVVYYREQLDGEDMIELDKENLIFAIEGEDQLIDTRRNIGM